MEKSKYVVLNSQTSQYPLDAFPDGVEAPIQMLRLILHRAVVAEAQFSGLTRSQNLSQPLEKLDPFNFLKRSVPIKRLRNSAQVVYKSVLPQLLASKNLDQAVPISIALVNRIQIEQINTYSSQEQPILPEVPGHKFIVTATPQGEIEFQLLDGGIAYWLDILLTHNLELKDVSPLPSLPNLPQRLFALQHTHARCCSLLRQGDREHFITLGSIEKCHQWQITQPPQIPWLTSHQQLQFGHIAEFSVASQVLELLDLVIELPRNFSKHLFLQSEKLSEAFDTLHRSCQPFHPAFQQNRDRLQVHFALILVTQRVLFQLLMTLGVEAPIEL